MCIMLMRNVDGSSHVCMRSCAYMNITVHLTTAVSSTSSAGDETLRLIGEREEVA